MFIIFHCHRYGWSSVPPAVTCQKVVSDLDYVVAFTRYSLGVSSTTYNWLVTDKLQYGRKNDDNQNSNFQ